MRLRKRETEWVGGAYGRRLDTGLPEGVLAELEIEHKATDERVERARLLFEEVKLADFEPLGTTGRRWLHRSTQREFVIDESQVLMAGDPRAGGVEYFAIHGDRILFFRPRDFDPVQRVHLATLVTGEVVRGPDGNDLLVPPEAERAKDPGMKLNPENQFSPLPIGQPVSGIAGFRLYGRGGKDSRREAQDRERGRASDLKLAQHYARQEREILEQMGIPASVAAEWEDRRHWAPLLRG